MSPSIRLTLTILIFGSLFMFLAIGIAFAQSPDNETWTQATASAGFLPRYSQTTDVFNNGSGEAMWVIGGNSVSYGLFNDVWFSHDGNVWVQAVNSTEFPARADHSSLVFQGKLWVIGGYGGARTFNDIWQSADGVHWKEVTRSAAFPVRYGHSSVVFDNKMWVIGGSGDSGNYYNDVWYSSDGVTWTLATDSAPFPPRYSHTSVVFDNKIWVIGGYNAQAGNLNDVWYSSDGKTWKEANNSAAWPARGDHTSLVFDRKMWLMGGSGDSGNFQDVWYSSDGEQWTQASGSAFFPARTCHSSLIFGKKAWIIGGWGDSGNLNDVWFTPVPVIPEITAINPAAAPDILPNVSVTITGSSFLPGALVILNRSGSADIRGTHIMLSGEGDMHGEFDLTGRPPGKYNLVITNPDGEQEMLKDAFSIIPKGADQTANTTIEGLDIANCGGARRIRADMAVLSANLSADGSRLELSPPANSGFRNIILFAADGSGFTRSNNSITGVAGNVTLESGEIRATGFSREVGSPVSVSYSLNLPAYPCDARVRTILWEGALPDDSNIFPRIAGHDNAQNSGTAYTAGIYGTGLPSDGTTTIRMSLNSSWNPLPGEGDSTIRIERIAADKKSGELLTTARVQHDPLLNLDYFEATSQSGPATFGISSLSGSNVQPIVIPLADSELPGIAEKPLDSTSATTRGAHEPAIPVDTGQTALLSLDHDGAVSNAVTLQSTDYLARVNILRGVAGKNPNGTPLASIMIKSIASEDIPSLPPGTDLSFAGRAYELEPDGATVSPEISVSFIAPHGQPGQLFQVKTFERETGTWQTVPARYDPETATVTAGVSHFSPLILFSKSGTEESGAGGSRTGDDSLHGSTTGQLPDILQGTLSAVRDNLTIIIGTVIIVLVIVFLPRKPRRYRIVYEK